MFSVSFVFFFQAEDGIRDADVTGVQTCALPISCLGRCDRAPAVMINDEIFEGVDAAQAAGMVQDVLAGKHLPRPRPPLLRTRLNSDPYLSAEERYAVLRELTQTQNYAGVIAN